MSYFTLHNKEKLYYEDIGKGKETLVFLHGWTSNCQIYQEPVRELKEISRCLIYDHRGHGKSKEASKEEVTMETLADDLQELLIGIGLKDVTLVGWSMGAGTIMTYLRKYGCNLLQRVILCDMTPKQLNETDWHLGLYQGKYTKEDMERSADKDLLSLYQEFAIGAVPKLKKVPGIMLKHILKKRLKSCDETVLKSLSASMKQQDNRNVFSKLNVPLAYFYAEPGTLFSPKLAEWYKEHTNTDYTAVPFHNRSHMLVTEQPDKFAKEIAKLIQ